MLFSRIWCFSALFNVPKRASMYHSNMDAASAGNRLISCLVLVVTAISTWASSGERTCVLDVELNCVPIRNKLRLCRAQRLTLLALVPRVRCRAL